MRRRERALAAPGGRLAVRLVAICEPYADAAKGPLALPRRAVFADLFHKDVGYKYLNYFV